MKHSLALAVTLALGFGLSAAAQTSPASAASPAKAAPIGPAKIAVIAFQVAIAQTNEGQRNFAEIEKKFDPKRQQLKVMSDDLDALAKKLQTQGATLSDTERASIAKSIDDKKKVFDRETENARNDFQGAMQEMISGLATKVYDVLVSYAQKQGYTLVLDESQQNGIVLVASAPTSDITKEVISAYNLKSGVPAPAAQPAAAPKPPSQPTKPATAH
jgi:outer membrane protein